MKNLKISIKIRKHQIELKKNEQRNIKLNFK